MDNFVGMDFQRKHESFGLVCCLLLVREFSFFEKIDICAVVTDSGFALIFRFMQNFKHFVIRGECVGSIFDSPPPHPPPKIICFGLLFFVRELSFSAK